ncbi:polysaccharide biosynthesis protein [Spirosoma sp. KNUC1025]|uniref:polysaccharide biosynthesis protein n=1 Tax=Spirosoma sp. KNUC1025 TaxID=2894082 RepID=UPI00386CDCE7|nr:polysaccharide biosynthesis protein [Spirosoma sp. KNUC1025]
MRAIVQRVYANPAYSKVFEWGKLVTITASAQVIVQATSFISGILVVRTLPTEEYALYTLANTMLGTITLLADGGISTGVMAEGRKVWQNPEKLGKVLVTGLNLRKKLAIISLLVFTPLLLFLLRHHHASWQTSILIILSLIPAFFTTLSGSLLQVPPKLHQDILPLQKNQIWANILRLVVLVLTILVFPWAFIAILASGIPLVWTNLKLKKLSKQYVDWQQNIDPEIQKEIFSFVKNILPLSIYYCISGQISIWLISFFGSTTSVAQVGAISRLSMLLTLFNVLINTLITPRFARLSDNVQLVLTRYLQIILGLVIICSAIIGLVWLFPSEVLWLLGNKYSNIQDEIIISVAASCLGLISGITFSLYTSRSWKINPVIAISINVCATIIAATLLDISTLKGILIFNVLIALVQVVMNTIYITNKIFSIPKITNN